MTAVTPPDMEAWLVSWLRERLTSDGLDVEVDSKEPAALVTPLDVPLVVVRDDSGPQTSVLSYQRQVGVSILAGTRQDDSLARDLARRVYALATSSDLPMVPGSPIAAVSRADCRGPYAVHDDQDVARRYLTVGYIAVGTW